MEGAIDQGLKLRKKFLVRLGEKGREGRVYQFQHIRYLRAFYGCISDGAKSRLTIPGGGLGHRQRCRIQTLTKVMK
jgi:hypothetical protein